MFQFWVALYLYEIDNIFYGRANRIRLESGSQPSQGLQRVHLKSRVIPYCCNLESKDNLLWKYFKVTKLLKSGM